MKNFTFTGKTTINAKSEKEAKKILATDDNVRDEFIFNAEISPKTKKYFAIAIPQWNRIRFYDSEAKFNAQKKFYFNGTGLKSIYAFAGDDYKYLERLPKAKEWNEQKPRPLL